MTNLVTYTEKAMEDFIAFLNEKMDEEPEKVYISCNAMKKALTEVEKKSSDGFKKYFDLYKELPGGWECKVSNRASYAFEEDSEWKELNEKLKKREELLKQATDAQMKGMILTLDNGEIIDGVTKSNTEVYSIKKK